VKKNIGICFPRERSVTTHFFFVQVTVWKGNAFQGMEILKSRYIVALWRRYTGALTF
jgi:hypothetical protein